MPAKEKTKYISLSRKASAEEVSDALGELDSWRNEMANTDSSLGRKNIAQKKSLPPVRGTEGTKPVEPHTVHENDMDDLTKYNILNKNQISKIKSRRVEFKVADLSDVQRKHKACKKNLQI